MDFLHRLAEQRIDEAVARGELDHLPGAGEPLVLADDALVPATMRMAMRVLKNAGCVPEEVSLRRQLGELRAQLDDAHGEQARTVLGERLRGVLTRLSMMHGNDLRLEAARHRAASRRLR